MSEVYANILEVLTTDLYNEINFAVREYLQNAYDAIKAARKEGLPEPEEDYHVTIYITKNNRIITIADNGIGMEEKILREYTSIGGGTKNDPDFAGHKGIGKLSGLRFFDKFVVRTKRFGVRVSYELDWESGKMMKTLEDEKEKMKRTPYKEFIKNFFTIKEIQGEKSDTHYTQIQLINATDEFKNQVDVDKIKLFIKKNCPVPLNKDSFQYADEIITRLDNELFFIETFVNEDKTLYQPYNDDHELVSPNFIDIKYADKIRAKVWFSWVNNTSEAITDEKIRGIKFRCKGICIGDNNLFANHCMPPGRASLADWFTGEVLVLDDNIKPSAARDRFCEGENYTKFYSELKRKVGKELSLIADSRSEIHTAKQHLKKFEKAKKDKAKNIPTILKKLQNRIKDLKRYESKNKYELDFRVIHEIEKAIQIEEKKSIQRIPEIKEETDVLLKEGNKQQLVEKMLDLKDEQIHTTVKKTKKAIDQQIKKLGSALIHKKHESTGNNSKFQNMDFTMLVDTIVRIIKKYFEDKKLEYNEKELRSFIINEFKQE